MKLSAFTGVDVKHTPLKASLPHDQATTLSAIVRP
jgi:hypothetical protein